MPKYRSNKAAGAEKSGTTASRPVVPIALNSGELWPRRAFLKRPGLITVSVGPPIPAAGRIERDVAAQVEAWIETQMRRLAPRRYAGPYDPTDYQSAGFERG